MSAMTIENYNTHETPAADNTGIVVLRLAPKLLARFPSDASRQSPTTPPSLASRQRQAAELEHGDDHQDTTHDTAATKKNRVVILRLAPKLLAQFSSDTSPRSHTAPSTLAGHRRKADEIDQDKQRPQKLRIVVLKAGISSPVPRIAKAVVLEDNHEDKKSPSPFLTLDQASASARRLRASIHNYCALGKLPGEVRNLIYRFTLLEPANIKIQATPQPEQQPTLLQICRQIRREALGIYYNENKFAFSIADFDASVLIKWSCSSPARRGCPKHLLFQAPPRSGSRQNLLVWLKAYFEGDVTSMGGTKIPSSGRSQRKAARPLFEMVGRMKEEGMSWEKVAAHLEFAFTVMAELNPVWK
jgi:hypothetical protein